MKLSINMITCDGENLIEKSLKSVLPYAYEAIVYDTGSTDGTPEVLEKMGVIYEVRDIQNSPDRRKKIVEILNEMKQRSKGDWILRVDDDEVFPKETMEEILAVDGEVPVYSIPFLHYEDGHFINPEAHSKQRPGFFVARLFKNIPQINWVNEWGSEVLSHNGQRVSSRAFQIHLCRKVKNPFLHLGELRKGKRKHEYLYHQKGHCSMPLGKYRKYI